MAFTPVKGLRLRATRVNACGMPIAGPRSRVVTEGWISLGLSPVMRDAEEIEQTNAEGRVCVADRTPPERKWWTVTLQLCKVDPCLFEMFTGWKLVKDWQGNYVGFRDAKRVPADKGVAIEIWSGVGSEDTCDVPTSDDILTAGGVGGIKYGYFLVPAIKEAQLGDIEIGAQAATFTLTGITANPAQWGKGPYNVVEIDAAGTAGRLLEQFDKDPHIHVQETFIAPPDVTDGCCGLVLPSPYYDGPGGTPAAVATAPNQPGCDQVATNEVQEVTLTADGALAFKGQQTSIIDVPAATSTQVQAALEALSTIGTGNVTVTGAAGGPYTVTFVNDLAETNQPAISVVPAASGSVVETTAGGTY